jgi:gamma-glutamylaminecyclotransferase
MDARLHKLFVYGTLMRGERAHHYLSAARFLAEGWTAPRYWLADMGEGYPALVAGGTTAVYGEIYRVDGSTLARLDAYEPAPDYYQRVRIEVAGHDSWVYLLPEHEARGCAAIVSGDWRRR